jgi:hypothetical protein
MQPKGVVNVLELDLVVERGLVEKVQLLFEENQVVEFGIRPISKWGAALNASAVLRQL